MKAQTIRRSHMTRETDPKVTLRPRSAVILAALAVVGAVLVSFMPTADAGSTLKRGEIHCVSVSQNNNVVGIWVDVDGGRDGWASRTNVNNNANTANWSYDTQGKRYRLFVGCGGTPWSWDTSTSTSWTRWGTNVTVSPNPWWWGNRATWT